MDLKDIYDAYMIDQSFEHLRSAGFHFVPGIGPEDPTKAEIVFVGEAPGVDEDKHREPFIGKAGKILNKYLRDIGLSKDEVFITNVLKYRPNLANRDPSIPEIQASFPYLRQEIDFIKPKLVVALGRIPCKAFLPSLEPRKVRGRLLDYNGYKLLVTLHPMSIVHQLGAREELKNQFEIIREVLKLR